MHYIHPHHALAVFRAAETELHRTTAQENLVRRVRKAQRREFWARRATVLTANLTRYARRLRTRAAWSSGDLGPSSP